MAIKFSGDLREQIAKLGEVVSERQELAGRDLDRLRDLMQKIGTDTDKVHESMKLARPEIDEREYRGALPLVDGCDVASGIDVPEKRPTSATLIAVDGSQAVPSRHDSHQYYLLNIGWIVYALGQAGAPVVDSVPSLFYVGDGKTERDDITATKVGVERDAREIVRLAAETWARRNQAEPLVPIMDQRLQYWPIGLQKGSLDYAQKWVEQMQKIEDAGGWLVGYVERPETSAIITMLNTYSYANGWSDVEVLTKRPELRDVSIYRRLLTAGQRSCVYQVFNLSAQYKPFVDKGQEICFFYFNPPGAGDVTRVDLPLWVAEQADVVEQIHGILYDQCLKLNGYPFVLTRADEMAVVRSEDREILERLIAQEMGKNGVWGRQTAKQVGKNLTRAGRRRR